MKNNIKYKIKLIVCYIGVFPDYFSLWLKSCEQNFSIDFLIVSNQNAPKWYPQNVSFLKTDISQLKIKFQEKVNFDIVLESPYKLCDYRPLYGLAFEDELKGYDFWGHCDIDLIWGDIRTFITDEILEKYDRIGGLGHFTIYRNTKKMNNAFLLSGSTFNYKKVFTNAINFAFDEVTGMNLICRKNRIPFLENISIADISYYYLRLRLDKRFNPYELFYWQNGHCYCAYLINNKLIKEEVMYIHFQRRKLKTYIEIPKTIESFILKEDGFYPNNTKTLDINNIYNYCTYGEYNSEQKQKRRYKINKLKMMINKSWKEKYIWVKQQFAIKKYSKKYYVRIM